MKEVAVSCDQIFKTYGTGAVAQPALRGITVDFFKGDVTLLMGPSGCGKTTLLSIISLILAQDRGQLEIFGEKITTFNEDYSADFRNTKIGFLFQNFFLVPGLTVCENIELPLLINGKNEEFARKRSCELLEQIGIPELCARWPNEISGGQQQRVAIARALINNPGLIICDEPTSSLDHKNGERIMQFLREHVRKPENSVIIATHDRRMLHYADRIVEMEDGMIERIYNPETP